MLYFVVNVWNTIFDWFLWLIDVLFQINWSVDCSGVQGTALHHGQCAHDTSHWTCPVGHCIGALLEEVSLARYLNKWPQHEWTQILFGCQMVKCKSLVWQNMENRWCGWVYIATRPGRMLWSNTIMFPFYLVCMCVCMSAPRFIQFALGICYAVHKRIVNIMKVVYRMEQHASWINMIV